MDNKKRSTLSWSASLAVHATGAVMILVAGFHLATPKGDVSDKTEFVTVDVNSQTTTTQQAPPPAAAPAAPDEQKAEVAKPAEVAPAPPPAAPETSNDSESEAPKPFTPTEPDENAAAQAPPPDIADTDAAPEPGSSPTNAEAAVPAMSPTNPDTTAAAAGPTPNGTPAEGMTPAASAADAAAQQAQNGSQGPLIDETKLMEAFGNHKPEYPWMARLRRQQGTVVLRAFVDKEGGVSQVTIEKSSGSQLIDEEAARSYARWRYQPGLSGQVLKPFKFSLK